MKGFKLFFLLAALLACLAIEASSQFVTGYYPVWSVGATRGGTQNPMYPHQFNWQGWTHIIHFGVGPTDTAPYWNPRASNNFGGPSSDSLNMFYAYDWRGGNTSYKMIDSLKKYARANGAKLCLSMGGIWGAQATNMNFITSDSGRTQTFVGAFIAFCARNGYDGVEIDYEPPGSRAQMSLLTRITRREMDAKLGPNAPLIITVANLAEANYDLSLQSMVTQYFFMMYDMHNPYNGIGSPGGPYDVTGFNAPLHLADPALYPILATSQLNYDGRRPVYTPQFWGPNKFADMGFSKGKIVVGIPFYGYVFPGKSAPNQPAGGIWAGYRSYIDILNAGGTKHWDAACEVPWMNNAEGYFTYEDTASVRRKVRWMKAGGFGGIGAYEMWTGYVSTANGIKDPLARAMIEEMGNVPPPPIILPSGTLNVQPMSLPYGGGTVSVSWSSQNATSATLNGSAVPLTSTGTNVTVTTTKDIVLILTNGSGTKSYIQTVAVDLPPPPPPPSLCNLDSADRAGYARAIRDSSGVASRERAIGVMQGTKAASLDSGNVVITRLPDGKQIYYKLVPKP